MTRLLLPLVFVAFLSFAACQTDGASTEPPSGWNAEGVDRWWQDGVDTTLAFRDLETLESMGIEVRERPDMAGHVQGRLIEFYRNHPEVVDSLFERIVLPDYADRDPAEDRTARGEQLMSEAYQAINRYFRAPMQRTQLGTDVPLNIPDSLSHIAGTFRAQIYLDENGNPVAIERLESVHPTLDALAMNAITQLEWQAAWVGRAQPTEIPSWARLNVNFRARP